MPLTIYSAHIVLLALWAPDAPTGAYFLLLAVVLTVFALVWRRHYGQGALERMLAVASRAVSR